MPFLPNHKDVFVKVPVNFTVKAADRKLYCAYVRFKTQSRRGNFRKKDVDICDKYNTAYWLKKLVARGWLTHEHGRYYLKAYQAVWDDLGIQKLSRRGRLKYAYYKIQDYDPFTTLREFMKWLEHLILDRIANRMVEQIRFRLAAQVTNCQTTTTGLSCKTVARLFGFDEISGISMAWKLREKYFKIVRYKVDGELVKAKARMVQIGVGEFTFLSPTSMIKI